MFCDYKCVAAVSDNHSAIHYTTSTASGELHTMHAYAQNHIQKANEIPPVYTVCSYGACTSSTNDVCNHTIRMIDLVSGFVPSKPLEEEGLVFTTCARAESIAKLLIKNLIKHAQV